MTFQRMTPTTSAGDHDDGNRVDHRRLHLALQLHGLFDVGREALENRVEDTARLARRHHVGEQRVERLRVLAHRVGERGARLDVGAGLQNDGREVLVLFLAAENVEALDERQAGVDHHGELTGEDGEVLRADLLAGLARLLLRGRVLLGLGGRDPRHHDLIAPERGDGGVHRVRRPLAVDGLPCARASGVCECRHTAYPLTLSSGASGSRPLLTPLASNLRLTVPAPAAAPSPACARGPRRRPRRRRG